MLHAFDAGKFRRGDNADTAGVTEKWGRGYFLWEDLTSGCPSYCSTEGICDACPNYGTGEELWAFIPANLLPRLKNALLQGDDQAFVDASPAVSDVYINSSWKTVLLSAQGNGGDTIFCLDITDPDNPLFLWEFADPELFRSRSSPSVGKIGRILMDGYPKWVAFFVSGKTFDDTLYPSIYVIDIGSGSLLERIYLDAVPQGAGGVPSGQPTVLDTDGNGYIDRLYIGTDKGYLYKVNIPDDPDTVKYNLSNCVINHDFVDADSNEVPEALRYQPIYGSPVVNVSRSVSSNGYSNYDVKIFFGTGDSPYYDEDINTSTTHYYFYAYLDQSDKGACNDAAVSLDWFLELPEGHRIFASAFAAAGTVYFGTSTSDTEDPCELAGESVSNLGRVFALSMDSGTVKFEQSVGNMIVSPVVADEHLYIRTQTYGLQSFGSGRYNNEVIHIGLPEIQPRSWLEIF